MEFNNRVTQLLGVETPIVQAPMGWIARHYRNILRRVGCDS